MLEDAFPAGRVPGEVAVGAERVEDRQGGVAVAGGRAGSCGAVSPARFQRPEAAIAAAELSSIRSGPAGTSKSQGGTKPSGQRCEEVVGVAPGDGQVGRVVRVRWTRCRSRRATRPGRGSRSSRRGAPGGSTGGGTRRSRGRRSPRARCSRRAGRASARSSGSGRRPGRRGPGRPVSRAA